VISLPVLVHHLSACPLFLLPWPMMLTKDGVGLLMEGCNPAMDVDCKSKLFKLS
jgi:hypothetical protein